MNSRVILNLALLALVAVLALVVIYKPGREEPPATPLTTLDTGTVNEIRIERRGRDAIAFARTEAGWRLTAPLTARANRFNVENVLRLPTARSDARVTAEGSLAPFGLEPPQGVVQFGDEQIELGSLHPMRNQVYVRYRGAVHLIAAHHQTGTTYGYSQFLDTRLFEDNRKPIAFRLPGFTLTHADGNWHRKPELKDLTGDRLNDFVREWQHASALSVERASATPVSATIEITFEGEAKPLRLGLVAHKPEFVLRRFDEKLDYHFPEDTGKRLMTLNAN